MVIAIDGPAGAGKSTVAKAVAKKLGFTYLDSGAMYRAVALSLLRDPNGTAPERAREVEIDFGDPDLRTPEVSEASSRVAQDPDVRVALVERQRELMQDGDWVAEGRDIGTVVAPRRRAEGLPHRRSGRARAPARGGARRRPRDRAP